MRVFELSAGSYKQFLSLLSILKSEFKDVIIKNDSFSSINDGKNAILKIKSVTGMSEFSIIINELKINLPLLKLLQNDSVKVYVDDKTEVNTFKGEPIELSLRYSKRVQNEIANTFDNNTKELTVITLSDSIIGKIEDAAKTLKISTFSIESNGNSLTLLIETPNHARKIKFFSIRTDMEEINEVLTFPVTPLVNYLQLIREFSEEDEISEIELSLLKSTTSEEYYLQTNASLEDREISLIVRREHTGDPLSVVTSEIEDAIDEREEMEEQESYSDGSLKIF